MKKKKIITIGVIIVILIAVTLVIVGKKNQKMPSINGNAKFFRGEESLEKKEDRFMPVIDEKYNIIGNKLTIGIGVKGADTGLGISAMAISFENLPAYLSNPKIQVAESSWNTNQSNLEQGKVKFVANNIDKPIAKDVANFFMVTFDVNGALTKGTQEVEAKVELVDTSKKAKSYVFNKEIKIISN